VSNGKHPMIQPFYLLSFKKIYIIKDRQSAEKCAKENRDNRIFRHVAACAYWKTFAPPPT